MPISSHYFLLLITIVVIIKVIPFSSFSLIFSLSFLYHRSIMAWQTRSSSSDSVPTFMAQSLLQNPEREICTFDNAYITALRSSDIFPDGVIFRPFDRDLRSDVVLRVALF
ncbi:hypothetical protein Hanom_Chr06g00566101 [Helianthus anomalus]